MHSVRVYVFMYANMYLRAYLCVYMQFFTNTCVHMHAIAHVFVCSLCVYMRFLFLCACVSEFMHARACTGVFMCT